MKRWFYFVVLLMALVPVYAFYHIDGVVKDISAYSITVVDNYAFIGGGLQLRVIDISDPCNPQLLDIAPNLYQGAGVVKDTLAYLSNYTYINVVNIADPFQPVLVAQIDSLSYISKFAVSAPFLYICSEDLTMQIIDISDVSNPLPAGTCPIMSYVSSITIANGLLFVSGRDNNINITKIIDVSDPYNPMIRYTYNSSSMVTGITVDGNIAYIAERYDGMLIWDISNPSQPVQFGTFNPGRAVFDISIQGDIACLANELNGILLVDISNPYNPLIIGTCDTPDFANHVVYRGNKVYVGCYEGFYIVDVSDPLPPVNMIGSYYMQGDEYSSLAIGNNYAYLVNSIWGLKILDVANPSLPELLTEYSDLGASRVQVVNNKAFILNAFGSYDIIDISDPNNPQTLGSYTGLSYPINASVVGNYAYILDGDEGLKILNISNAASPSLMGSYTDLVYPYAIAIRGNYVSIIDRAVAFPKAYVLNVSNHASPQDVGFCYLPDEPNSISYYGTYTYIVSGEAGLQVYQSDSYSPLTLLSSFLPHPTSDLVYCFVDGARLYVSDYNWNEIDVFDLTDPSQPNLIRTFKSNYATIDMKISNNLLYTANEYAGMHIFDLNANVGIEEPLPIAPMLSVSSYPNPFNPQTTIAYTLPMKGHVELNIYNVRGQLVRHLVDENNLEGTHTVVWNGKDDQNRDIASGMYVYKISCGTKQMSGRMMLLK